MRHLRYGLLSPMCEASEIKDFRESVKKSRSCEIEVLLVVLLLERVVGVSLNLPGTTASARGGPGKVQGHSDNSLYSDGRSYI